MCGERWSVPSCCCSMIEKTNGTYTGVFIPDADPSTTTDPLDDDSDNDGKLDVEEDENHNGRVDPGEGGPNRGNALPFIPLLLLN